jgi:hypothetical protein
VIDLIIGSGVFAMSWSAISSNAVVVREFSAPNSIADEGFTGKVVASNILDVLLTMQSETRAVAAQHRITDAWTDTIEVAVPETGVLLGQFSDALHRLFGHDVHVDGALVETPQGLSLSIRGDQIAPAIFPGDHAHIDTLFRKAAEYVLGHVQPPLYVSYLIAKGRTDHAITFVRNAFPRLDDAQRPALANLLGEALLIENRIPEAADAFRLALQIGPRRWRAWNNLVGVLT